MYSVNPALMFVFIISLLVSYYLFLFGSHVEKWIKFHNARFSFTVTSIDILCDIIVIIQVDLSDSNLVLSEPQFNFMSIKVSKNPSSLSCFWK